MSFALLTACGSGEAQADDPSLASSGANANPTPHSESDPEESRGAIEPLGVADVGIWSDLDDRVSLPAPKLSGRGIAILDPERKLLLIYDGDLAVKVYPTGGASRLTIDGHTVQLRQADATELGSLGSTLRLRTLERNEKPPGGDDDNDGIPNGLDLLIGAKKTVLNAARYGAGYIKLEYPGGDVPREVGVCSDVVIRAVRNAGLDLQSALHKDIRAAKRAYPMVKKRNAHIDHRRVKTLLPYFKRHWQPRAKGLGDKRDPLRAGDVVFMDTFPNRPGPDHIGIVGFERGPSGHPLIINNWTDGSVTAKLDLLDFVPITHRFRMR